MKFSYNSAIVDIEDSNGLSFKELPNLGFLGVFSTFWQMLSEEFGIKISRFLRIGSRFWAIKETTDSFETVREKFQKMMPLLEPLSDQLKLKPADLSYIFEGSDPADSKIRIISGPYHKSEINKYFSFIKPEESFGQIVDLDIRDDNIEIHGLKTFKQISLVAPKAEETVCKMWQI